MSMWPSNCWRWIALGFMTYRLTGLPSFLYAPSSICHSDDLPEPEGPTMMMPMRWEQAMCSCKTFSICDGTFS